MPEQYLAIKRKFLKKGKSLKYAKKHAAMIYNAAHPGHPVTRSHHESFCDFMETHWEKPNIDKVKVFAKFGKQPSQSTSLKNQRSSVARAAAVEKTRIKKKRVKMGENTETVGIGMITPESDRRYTAKDKSSAKPVKEIKNMDHRDVGHERGGMAEDLKLSQFTIKKTQGQSSPIYKNKSKQPGSEHSEVFNALANLAAIPIKNDNSVGVATGAALSAISRKHARYVVNTAQTKYDKKNESIINETRPDHPIPARHKYLRSLLAKDISSTKKDIRDLYVPVKGAQPAKELGLQFSRKAKEFSNTTTVFDDPNDNAASQAISKVYQTAADKSYGLANTLLDKKAKIIRFPTEKARKVEEFCNFIENYINEISKHHPLQDRQTRTRIARHVKELRAYADIDAKIGHESHPMSKMKLAGKLDLAKDAITTLPVNKINTGAAVVYRNAADKMASVSDKLWDKQNKQDKEEKPKSKSNPMDYDPDETVN